MQLVMIAAPQWLLYYNVVYDCFCEDSTIYNTLAALVGYIHVELRNCTAPGTTTFGPVPLCSVVSPI